MSGRSRVSGTTDRLVGRADFSRSFDEGRTAVLAGDHRVQTPPVEGSFRWGLSALLRPDADSAGMLATVTRDAAEIAGGGHWLTGLEESSHLTLRSLEPWRDTIAEDDLLLQRYAAALDTAVVGFGPLTFQVVGLTLTLGSVMACGVPVNDAPDRMAAAYGEALGPDGWHERQFTREFWYLNLLHFAGPIATAARLIDWVAARRERHIATVVVGDVRLIRWRFTGHGMSPQTMATARLG